jgi:hypothetical protein
MALPFSLFLLYTGRAVECRYASHPLPTSRDRLTPELGRDRAEERTTIPPVSEASVAFSTDPLDQQESLSRNQLRVRMELRPRVLLSESGGL